MPSTPMPSNRSSAKILIVDSDAEFLARMSEKDDFSSAGLLTAKSRAEAQLLIANRSHSILAVIINSKISDQNGILLIRFCHQIRPVTPVYLLHDGESPLSSEELRKLRVQGEFLKPVTYPEILAKVAPTIHFNDQRRLYGDQSQPDNPDSSPKSEPVEQEVESDYNFVPIRASDFVAGSVSCFDVFVKLSSGRYLKILKNGDSFSPERLSSYLEKGVTHFYLESTAQKQYLAYCDHIAATLIRNKEKSIELRKNRTLVLGEETMNFLRSQGVNQNHLSYANNFVENVHHLVQQRGDVTQKLLDSLKDDIVRYEHSVATTVIASMLIQPFRIENTTTVKVIGLTCLLHDIGLTQLNMDADVSTEDESKMSPEQREIFYRHPAVGAEMLKTIPGMTDVSVQAVLQHHERRNKKGFPARLGAGAINRVAEIIGISDEYVRLIQQSAENPKLDILAEMEKNVFYGFSHPVVEAFRAVFFSSKSKAA